MEHQQQLPWGPRLNGKIITGTPLDDDDTAPDLQRLYIESRQVIVGDQQPGADDQQVAAGEQPAASVGPALAPSAPPATPAPQHLLRYLPAIAVVLLVALAFFVVFGGEDTPVPTPPTAVPTVAPTAAAVVASTTVAERALVGFFDYRDSKTFTGVSARNLARIIGKAGDEWRLVLLGDGAEVWLHTVDVPADLPADSPLTDLTPKADPPVAVAPPAAAPPVVEQPAVVPPVAAPPAATPAPPAAARVSGEIELSRAPATAESPAPAAAAEAETASFRVGGCGPDGSSKCPRTLPRVRER